jgi:hypothetical protein
MSLLSILCYLRKEKDWGGGSLGFQISM